VVGQRGTTESIDTWSGMLYASADGDRLVPYKTKYRVSAIAYHDYGLVDPTEIRNLSKSSLYEISTGEIYMSFKINEQFREEARQGARGTSYRILLVPHGVTMDQFDTLKQAKALGVLLGGAGIGPP